MTYARSQLIPPGSDGCYHCVQRCVRRAFLCGDDPYTGRSFGHRRAWIEDRLHLLGQCFAIAVHAYAIMENHLHLVVQIHPDAVATWSDEEIAARWARIFPASQRLDAEIKCQELVSNPNRMGLLRARLCDLSWFMRCLAEPIARRANQEDGCKGRFWEGRYKCQVLCDERALLAAMAYVDLNPIRAGITDRLDACLHTSAHKRIDDSRAMPERLSTSLRPIIGIPRPGLSLTTADYLQILDWTGRTLTPGKHGRIAGDAPAILTTIDSGSKQWTARVRGYGGGWARAAGSALSLMDLAERIGQRWLRGARLALLLS